MESIGVFAAKLGYEVIFYLRKIKHNVRGILISLQKSDFENLRMLLQAFG